MSAQRQEMDARVAELFCDAALAGLAPHEHTELAALLVQTGRVPGSDEEKSYERAAAAIALAGTAVRSEALPAFLASRIEERAIEAIGAGVGTTGGTGGAAMRSNVIAMGDRRAARWPLALGWAAAAVFLLVALGVLVKKPREVVVTKTIEVPASVSAAPPPLAPKAAREALLARAGTVQMEWNATKDPASKDAVGDVVWNQNEQRGFMRFHGLATNDPKQIQYQLWIFDKNRDARYPVDGGVFDIDAESGDVIVPITARVPVTEATLFAVTVEKPGGVVVSKRERIVVTAKPS